MLRRRLIEDFQEILLLGELRRSEIEGRSRSSSSFDQVAVIPVAVGLEQRAARS